MKRISLDPIIHAPARLQIMAVLTKGISLGRVEFTCLRNDLGLTDGNLGAHVLTLERAGYVRISKDFDGRRPRTTIEITPFGRQAYSCHVEQLQFILFNSEDPNLLLREA